MNTTGKKILTGRKLLGLSQEEFIKHIRVSNLELAMIEDEQIVPSKEIIRRIEEQWELSNLETTELVDIMEHILTNSNRIKANYINGFEKVKSPVNPKYSLVEGIIHRPSNSTYDKDAYPITKHVCGLMDIIIIKDKSYSSVEILYNGNTSVPEDRIVLSKRTVDIYSFSMLLKRFERPFAEWSLDDMSKTICMYPELIFTIAIENPAIGQVLSEFDKEKMVQFYMMGMSAEEECRFREEIYS